MKVDINTEVVEILNDPDKQIELLEKMYGEQLYPHQKIFINFMIRNKEKELIINYPFRSGKTMVKRFMERWKETFMNNKVGDSTNE